MAGDGRFGVESVDFTLSELLFNVPAGKCPTDSQVRLQGALSFDRVSVLSGAGLTAAVDGTNDVVADKTGITVTGGRVSKTWTVERVAEGAQHGAGRQLRPVRAEAGGWDSG